MQIINEIKMIRELLNLSQKDLAKELDVSFQTINRWENSKNEIEQYNIEKYNLNCNCSNRLILNCTINL